MSSSRLIQVKSGLRLGCWIILYILTIYLLVDGLGTISSTLRSGNFPWTEAVALGELILAATVLLLTIRRWAKWIAALFLLAGLKSVVGLVSGTTLTPPFNPVPRLIAAEAVLVFFAAAALTIRYKEKPLNILDKIALIVLVFGICWEMVVEPSFLLLGPSIGVIALTIAWLNDRTKRSKSYPNRVDAPTHI